MSDFTTEETVKQPDEWKVFFQDSFYTAQARGKPGTPLSIRKDFIWAGRYWLIPEVYVCGKGLVIDFCIQIPAEEIRAYQRKWEEDPSLTPNSLDLARQMADDNPLNLWFSPEATLNGRALLHAAGGGTSWKPNVKVEPYMQEAEAVVHHYNLDPATGWVLWRYTFSWATTHKPKRFSTLQLKLTEHPARQRGEIFSLTAPGDQYVFTHPFTGTRHTLTVQEYEARSFPADHNPDPDLVFPPHYTGMVYTLAPDLPAAAVSVQSCLEGDRPRPKDAGTEKGYVASSSILFGRCVDDGTPLKYGGSKEGKPRAAFSSTTFAPCPATEWRLTFHSANVKEILIPLL